MALRLARLRDPAFLGYFLPLVRTDLTACETFQPTTGTLLRCWRLPTCVRRLHAEPRAHVMKWGWVLMTLQPIPYRRWVAGAPSSSGDGRLRAVFMRMA